MHSRIENNTIKQVRCLENYINCIVCNVFTPTRKTLDF